MTQVTFYIVEQQPDLNVSAVVHYACELASQHYRQNNRVFIFADNQQQAEQIDEYLWQFNPAKFVPHNLLGEGPKYGSPVEISWQPPRGRKDVLINISQQMPAFAKQFKQVCDFVPADEAEKVQARERYKHYRAAGFALATTPATTI